MMSHSTTPFCTCVLHGSTKTCPYPWQGGNYFRHFSGNGRGGGNLVRLFVGKALPTGLNILAIMGPYNISSQSDSFCEIISVKNIKKPNYCSSLAKWYFLLSQIVLYLKSFTFSLKICVSDVKSQIPQHLVGQTYLNLTLSSAFTFTPESSKFILLYLLPCLTLSPVMSFQ